MFLNQRCEIIQSTLQRDQQLSNNQSNVLTDIRLRISDYPNNYLFFAKVPNISLINDGKAHLRYKNRNINDL